MAKLALVLAVAAFFASLFSWGFRRLPGESWQFIAAVPQVRKKGEGWRAVNLTFYGFFNASACIFSCGVVLFLMGSLGVPFVVTLTVLMILLAICYPASRLVASIVEKKKHTYTIGGASFVGFLILPWLIQLFNLLVGPGVAPIPLAPMLGAVAIGYAFGEAFGRMACISFGCCYGKLISQTPRAAQRIFGRFCFVFSGETKKVAYESGLTGMPLVPIQAVTAVVSATAGLIGLWCFLNAQWTAAVLIPTGATQLWRAFSETLRADYRGGGRISTYQIMALVAFVYSVAVLLIVESAATTTPDLTAGLRGLMTAKAIVVLEALWLAVFMYLGRSSVTSSDLSFHVVKERV
ncbi:MAG TPA: prolipoprotein diacylglyceryl transferase family protein [Pyrinomonadaceae bacterium]